MRRHVLRKALLAVDDLNRQAEAEALATPIRRVLLSWQRSHIWQLLTLRCLADEPPLGEQEIVERVLAEFQNMPGDKTDLADLCDEASVTAEALKAEIERTVSGIDPVRPLVAGQFLTSTLHAGVNGSGVAVGIRPGKIGR